MQAALERWESLCSGSGALRFADILLRGTGQVMFQNHPLTGLLFLVGIAWGSWVAGVPQVFFGGLLGLVVATLTAMWLRVDKEGLAAGRPVISTAPGQAARLLAEGGCGSAGPPGDAAGLAAALTSLVEDPARRAMMGAAARSLAVRQHDRRLLAARFAALVEAIPVPARGLSTTNRLVVSGRG